MISISIIAYAAIITHCVTCQLIQNWGLLLETLMISGPCGFIKLRLMVSFSQLLWLGLWPFDLHLHSPAHTLPWREFLCRNLSPRACHQSQSNQLKSEFPHWVSLPSELQLPKPWPVFPKWTGNCDGKSREFAASLVCHDWSLLSLLVAQDLSLSTHPNSRFWSMEMLQAPFSLICPHCSVFTVCVPLGDPDSQV